MPIAVPSQLPLPFIVRVAFFLVSRSVRSIVRAGRTDTYQNVEKRAKPANIAAYVSGNRLLYRPLLGGKREKEMPGKYIVRISDNFYFPVHATL